MLDRLRAHARVPVVVTVLALVLVVVAPLATSEPRATVSIQLVSFSDWHGQVDPMVVGGVPIGGAAVLAAYFDAERAANPNTLVLTAGDAFGASPPIASFFDEVPAVRALNLMGLDADALGNHNFDRGVAHLRAMTEVAQYDVLAANLVDPLGELPDVAPYAIYDVGGVKVAVVGLLNPEAPSLVKVGAFGSVGISDPYKAAKEARTAAKSEGAVVFVAIAHMGITGLEPLSGKPMGELADLAAELQMFDVILGDHTDFQYAQLHNQTLTVENRSKGITYSRVTLEVDARNGRVVDRSWAFITPRASGVTPDAEVVEMLKPYRTQLSVLFDRPIGVAAGLFPRGGNVERLQEVALGNLVADAMRATYGTQLAVVNGGGLRNALPSSHLPADTTLRRNSPGYAAGPPYDLVVGDALAVLPFGNVAVTREVTGAKLHDVLELSVAAIPGANGRFLQVSGFAFQYDAARPAGARLVSVTLDGGSPILDDGTVYTITLPDFVNGGGDGYTMLADGQGVTRDVLMDVVAAHIEAEGTITPVVEGRITKHA